MALPVFRRVKVYLPWSVLSVITVVTIGSLFVITIGYHFRSIQSVFAISHSLLATTQYTWALFIGLPSILSWLTTIGLAITIMGTQINGWLIYQYQREFKSVGNTRRSSVAGISGLVAGMFGVGCSACGTTLLVGLLGTVGGLPLLALLPLHGSELIIVGIMVTIGTTIYLLRKLLGPRTCPTT